MPCSRSTPRGGSEMSDHREVALRVKRSIGQNHGFVVVDTLKYLYRGGRIGKTQALLGGAPIQAYPEHPRRRFPPRGPSPHLQEGDGPDHRDSAQLAPIHQMQVSYSTGRDHAQAIRDGLADQVEPERIVESRFGPVLGTHLGPNTIGVAVTQGNVEDE